jgi:hypothetical protein
MFTKKFPQIAFNFTKNIILKPIATRMSATEAKIMKVAPNTIGTHSGTFHCDEVLAVFMLQKLPKFKNHKILRTRAQELLDQCEIVVDVGAVYDPAKLRFDHHQVSGKLKS